MIAIVDYRAGNLTSVRLAVEAIGAEGRVTDKPEDILAADRVIFPGVGAAGSAMQNLADMGLIDTLKTVVGRETPFLGICLGTQIIFEQLEEDGGTTGMGVVPGAVRLFEPSDPRDKVPQMGWNSVAFVKSHPVFEGIDSESEFYFVHSYYPDCADRQLVLGETSYADVTYASIVGRDNLIAMQFHPEKSGRVGLKLLANFTKWDGRC